MSAADSTRAAADSQIAVPLPTNWRFQNLTGRRFFRLVVARYVGRNASKRSMWLCQCDCGNQTISAAGSLLRGDSKSCGCYAAERTTQTHVTHGMSKTPEFRVWTNMRSRCFCKSTPNYRYYGGRGISVCERWAQSFEAFIEDMGLRPGNDYELDRIDNDGNYCPENCRWATRTVQQRNRRQNRVLEFRGERLCVTEWAEKVGLSVSGLRFRLKMGWSIEDALTQPAENVPLKNR